MSERRMAESIEAKLERLAKPVDAAKRPTIVLPEPLPPRAAAGQPSVPRPEQPGDRVAPSPRLPGASAVPAQPQPKMPSAEDVGSPCPVCGTVNAPSRRFCRSCGTDLRDVLAAPPPPPPAAKPAGPTLESLADYLTAYIPTWVVSLFVPLWSALVAAEIGGAHFELPVKLAIAIATGLAAGIWVWGDGYQRAARAARRRGREPAGPLRALTVGAWEVGAASVAAFAWATAAPSSWAAFNNAFWPLATVIGATVVLGLVGKFIAPLETAG